LSRAIRYRVVFLGGLAALLQDMFWFSMAVTIMAGLMVGTVLTMVVVPTLYALFFRISAPAR
jgi:multidrug efflux pump subunit AcrB